MRVTIAINKFYRYAADLELKPTPAELASGECASISGGLFGRRVLHEAPDCKNAAGEPAELRIDVPDSFFDDVGTNPIQRAVYLGTHIITRVLPWNTPRDGVVSVKVADDSKLEAALAGFLDVEA